MKIETQTRNGTKQVEVEDFIYEHLDETSYDQVGQIETLEYQLDNLKRFVAFVVTQLIKGKPFNLNELFGKLPYFDAEEIKVIEEKV